MTIGARWSNITWPTERDAQRTNVTLSWLFRYLDLARLPPELLAAFASFHNLGIEHVTRLKPL